MQMQYVCYIKGSIDVPPPVKELDYDNSNRLRCPEQFSNGSAVQIEALVEPSNDLLENNTMETIVEEDIVSDKINEENDENKQVSSEDSEEDSDDDIVVAAGNFTLSSIESNMASLSQQNNASPSTAGINLKRNNLLTLTNIPGVSAGSKVSKIILKLKIKYYFISNKFNY